MSKNEDKNVFRMSKNRVKNDLRMLKSEDKTVFRKCRKVKIKTPSRINEHMNQNASYSLQNVLRNEADRGNVQKNKSIKQRLNLSRS